MGAVLGPTGAAIGAAVGGISGAISGGTEIFKARDDAFKSYVQEAAEEQQTKMSGDIESGSSIAAGREQKKLAFTTLLGSEAKASDFLDEVKAMASTTNYTYDEITGYAKSLVKPFGTGQTMDILTALSDTSAALSLNESDNSVLIAGLSRMKLTDKTTQEYLNYFSERGIDVYEALSKWGDAATVAQKVSAGKIKGSEAVEALLAYMQEQYGGLSAQMANTYEGMMGNLEDAKANAQEQYGIGYNENRKEGIQAEIDWYEDESADEANQAIGAWYAHLDNEKERYRREAEAKMKESDEYQQAKAEGDAAEMGRLIMQARAQGMNEYNASEGAQEALAAEKALVEGIRGDTALRNDYWDAGYEMGQEYSKGWAAGRAANPVEVEYFDVTGGHQSYRRAMGQQVVPYDNFPALLHQGERVLTASQARAADRGMGVNVTFSGPVTVREEADLDRLAAKLAANVVRAVELGV